MESTYSRTYRNKHRQSVKETEPSKSLAEKVIQQFIFSIFIFLAIFILTRVDQPITKQITNKIKKELNHTLDISQLTQYPQKLMETFNLFKADQIAVPLKGEITSKFGNRVHPVTNTESFHSGIDIASPEGTPFKCAMDGTVYETGLDENYGNYIIINSKNDFSTFYAHCSKIDVEPGDKVTEGQNIGEVGNTGISSGSHLHFEIRIQDSPVNPEDYVKVQV